MIECERESKESMIEREIVCEREIVWYKRERQREIENMSEWDSVCERGYVSMREMIID